MAKKVSVRGINGIVEERSNSKMYRAEEVTVE